MTMKQLHGSIGLEKHPAEFEFFDLVKQLQRVVVDRFQRIVVLFFLCHFEKFGRVIQAGFDPGEGKNDVFKGFFFLAEILCLFRIVPDVRVFQFGVYLLKLV